MLLALALFAWLAAAPGGDVRAQWVQMNGPMRHNNFPGVGTVYANGTTMFVSCNEGILRSTDNGVSWELDTSGVGRLYGYCFIQMGTKFFVGTDSGLFQSTENSFGWTLCNSGLKGRYGLFVYDSLLFAGIAYSRDTGKTWIVDTSAIGRHDGSYFAGNNFCIFAGGYNYLYRSTNNGTSWIQLDSMPFSINGIVVSDSIIIAYGSSVARSKDNGIHWALDTVGLFAGGLSELFYLVAIDSNLIGLSYDENDTIPLVFPVILEPSFQQDAWQPIAKLYGQTSAFGDVACLTANGNMLFAGTANGLLISSNNGRYWVNNAVPMPVTDYISVSSLSSIGSNVFAGSASSNAYDNSGIGIFLSTDNGIDWIDTPLFSELTYCLTTSGGNVIAGTRYGLAVSTNNGAEWILQQSDEIISIASYGSNVFAGTNYGILYHSTDAGLSWSSQQVANFLSCVAVHNNTVLVASDGGGAVRSTDNGISWITDTNGLGNNITQFAFCNGIVLAVAGGSLFISPDDGVTWILNVENWTYNPDDDYPPRFASKGDDIFAATYYEINLSTNNGADWSYGIDSGTLFQGSETSFLFEDSDILVGSEGGSLYGGLWRRPLSDFGISSVAQTPSVPQPTIQSYPNPFSQSTEIAFTSATAGYADVSVVNILDAPVVHLFSGELDAGEHEFMWNANNTAPGSYWCVVRMGDSVERVALSVQR